MASDIAGTTKTVQELIENGEDGVPDRYLWIDKSDYGPIDLHVPFTSDISVIDLSQLFSESNDVELVKLRSALNSWGCFQAINHGMEDSFLDEMREVSRQFFHLPMEEKQKYTRPVDGIEGYGNDPQNQHFDWVDRLYLLVTPKDLQKLQFWPENPKSFRTMLQEYTYKIIDIQEQLLMSIARSINLPEDTFLNQFGKRSMIMSRFNYYPPCSKPDLVVGLRPHSDGSGITFLLQDEQVEGLQVKKDNNWFQVPIMPYALFVNVGDQLEILSNGVFKSSVHRAMTNSERERSSVVMFCAPDPEVDIGPVEELVDDERPKFYKTLKNYPETYYRIYQEGVRPITAVRI